MKSTIRPSRKASRAAVLTGLTLSALVAAGDVCAQSVVAAPVPAGAADSAPAERSWVGQATDSARRTYARIRDEGNWDVYLSGYARHSRRTYTPERIHDFNEYAWGAGFGKTLRDERGNDQSVFGLAISDSHSDPQLMAGYIREWIWPVASTGLEAGIGYSAMLMSRQDIFGGFPFPAVLPVASIGTQRARLMAAYVTRLSTNKGNGDVLYLVGRFSFD
jgi:palmitoyl transferase